MRLTDYVRTVRVRRQASERAKARRRPDVAFVLSGGGVLGAAQVGQLQALIASGIRPGALVATSVGAILRNPWGNHPHKFPAGDCDPKVDSAAVGYGTPRSGTE